MRIVRARRGDVTFLARVEGAVAVPILREESWPGFDPIRVALAGTTELSLLPPVAEELPLSETVLLAPVAAPSKVVAIGLNYVDHAAEARVQPPAAPLVFVKTPNAIVGPGDPIRYAAADSTQVDYEAELAVVIGRRAQRVSEAEALSYVLGYTACNDVSARDAQFSDGQWVRGKSYDTFCPLGPAIVTAEEIPDPQDLRISCQVDGRLLQDDSTANMIFSVAEIISYLSRFITLEVGDVIATGTPPGVGFTRTPPVYLTDGATVEVAVEQVGSLVNPVVVR